VQRGEQMQEEATPGKQRKRTRKQKRGTRNNC
jgi:hypothetical protein